MFRANHTFYRIAEPLITFYYSVMRPVWSQLEQPGAAARVWATRRRQFTSNVLGPRFEQICREWAMYHAAPDMFANLPAKAGGGVVNDPHARTSHEVDVVLIGAADGARPPLLSIGECKWNDTMGVSHLERLRHIKDLITTSGRYDTTATRLACYSSTGFTPELHALAADADDILLVGLDDLYGLPRRPLVP